MGIISELKSTYNFAKGELKSDLKRNPTTAKAIKKVKRFAKSPQKIKFTKVKRGKSISTEKALKKIKKGVPKSRFKRAKYKSKKSSQIRRETFNIGLNLKY